MKPKKRMRSSKVDVGLDRLSEMPDQVIVHILSRMPTRDAVKTMLLRRFGNLWTMLPTLGFDFNDHYVGNYNLEDNNEDGDEDEDKDEAYEEEQRIMSEAFSRFARYVRNMLMLHRRSTIDSFHLEIGKCKSNHVDAWLIDDVQTWLKFATDREVKDLSFSCDHLDDIAPPHSVFTSQSLVTLSLCGSLLVQYEHQPQLHMGTLKKLSLIGVHGSNEAFNQLISACPSIQSLKIYNSEGLTDLNITAPSANKLLLEIADVPDRPFTLNCPHVKILSIAVDTRCETSQSFPLDVINVSSLQVVYLRRLPICSTGLMIKAFLKHFQDVDIFRLTRQVFEKLCCVGKVDFPQNKWRRLAIQAWWYNERCLQVIMELVKSSVDLEGLAVYESGGQSWGSEGYNEVLSSELSTCVMPQLKDVHIRGYGGCYEGQFQLVELLLRNAVVLEKLEIVFQQKNRKNRLTAVKKLDYVKQVSRLKRASVNAIVEFLEKHRSIKVNASVGN